MMKMYVFTDDNNKTYSIEGTSLKIAMQVLRLFYGNVNVIDYKVISNDENDDEENEDTSYEDLCDIIYDTRYNDFCDFYDCENCYQIIIVLF